MLPVAGLALVAASLSGAAAQPAEPLATGLPALYFASGPGHLTSTAREARPLGPGAPHWARRLYRRSVRVLVAFTDPGSGAEIAGGGPTAVYLLGHALFRRFLGLSFRPWRGLGILLALATIPLGTSASALAQLAVLVAALGVCLAAEGEPAQ